MNRFDKKNHFLRVTGLASGLRAFLIFMTVAATNWVCAASPDLHVMGSQILTVSGGCTVRLRGVNADSMEYTTTGQGPAGGITAVVAEAVMAWGANVIRLPLSQDYWFGCTNSKVGNAPVNGANYQALVTSIVNYCSSQNAYVILDLHWSGTQTGATAPCGAGWDAATAQQYMPDDNSVTFWSSVAALYANNPAVLFDLYNEPYDYVGNGWSVWRDGGTNGFHTPGMQALLNTVRATGANNVVVMGGLDYAYDLSQVGAYPVTNKGNGVVYSSHIYPFKGSNPWNVNDGNSKIAPATFTGPILIGEFGQGNGSPDSTGAWDTALMNWINQGGFSGTAWDMHYNSCPCLLQSDWVTPTSWHGVPVKNWLATPGPVCAFTPTPTPTSTPCGFPGSTCTPTNTPTPTSTPTPTNTPNPNNDRAWPNPWDGTQPLSFFHTLDKKVDSVHLKIYTVAFRKIYDDGGLVTEAGQQIDSLSWSQLGNVANGFYYLVVEEDSGSQVNRKVIKLLIRR